MTAKVLPRNSLVGAFFQWILPTVRGRGGRDARLYLALMVYYTDTLADITPDMLGGFFVGWPNPPSPETHLQVLRGSYAVVLAVDGGRVVGVVNAISDGCLSAFIPLLEVLPERQGEGIGSELMRLMRERLSAFYSIDLLCDSDVQPFYERLGWRKGVGMCIRNYDRSAGVPTSIQ